MSNQVRVFLIYTAPTEDFEEDWELSGVEPPCSSESGNCNPQCQGCWAAGYIDSVGVGYGLLDCFDPEDIPTKDAIVVVTGKMVMDRPTGEDLYGDDCFEIDSVEIK